jgi:(R)-2-hydroxyacyl-CoA dehydratese activating ATPase
MRGAGIDIGSRAIKVVLIEDGRAIYHAVADTGSDPLAVCRSLLDGTRYDRVIATGYGRHLFKQHQPESEVVSEIRAVSVGATSLYPDCRTIIDIGGQDSKAISLNPAGKVQKFVMNDRCAAGTGQFLEMMATALAYSRDEFVIASQRATGEHKLSSMCSVFAQSEIISLIAHGVPKEQIARGVHQSVASRTVSLAGGVPIVPPVVFTGGCARNECLASLISEALNIRLIVAKDAQTVAALGCALICTR